MRPLKVLIVDGNDADHRLMKEASAAVGADCVFVAVSTTHSALRYLCEGLRPDLIVITLDPDMTGLESLRRLKAHDKGQGIPVAVLAGGLGPHEALTVESLGASFYSRKPLDFDGHIRLVSQLIELVH